MKKGYTPLPTRPKAAGPPSAKPAPVVAGAAPRRAPPVAKPIAPGQPAPPGRVRERFVSLPEGPGGSGVGDAAAEGRSPSVVEPSSAGGSGGSGAAVGVAGGGGAASAAAAAAEAKAAGSGVVPAVSGPASAVLPPGVSSGASGVGVAGSAAALASRPLPSPPSALDDLSALSNLRGRIGIYCIAESLDRLELERALKARGNCSFLEGFPDALHGRWSSAPGERPRGDVFYFDYGVVVFWGLTQRAEAAALASIAAYAIDPLETREVELDEFEFRYSASERAHVQNDVFTINYRSAGDHLIKLSISHALAQSTKLSVYEERVVAIVEQTRDLPERLATTGRVDMSRKAISQLIGRVFIQKAAVNLLSTVLDTPEFFWSAPDALQELYKRVGEYAEYDTRVEVLNQRFQVLQEMLDMLRDHQNNFHGVRLEWIVIWLIVVECVVGLFECASILGWVGHEA